MTTIYFIRHCSVLYTGNPLLDLNIRLSPQGLSQASSLAHNWSSRLDRIYCSPLPRAIETVIPLSKKVGIKNLIRIDDLRELDYKGNAQLFHKKIRDNISFKFPGGETITQANLRFKRAVIKIGNESCDLSVAISTHGTLLSEFLISQFNFHSDFFFQLSYPDVYEVQYIKPKFTFIKRNLSYLPETTENNSI